MSALSLFYLSLVILVVIATLAFGVLVIARLFDR